MKPNQIGRSSAVKLDGATRTAPVQLEREAILVTRTHRGRRTRRAALGLLLNRVKRMRIRENTQIEIICDDLAVLIPPVVDLTLAGVAQRVEHA